MNVKFVFLNDILEEVIYVNQPTTYVIQHM